MPKPSVEVPGTQQLAEAVQQAAQAKGWRFHELERQSHKKMTDHPSAGDRIRVGVSRRTWQKIWRGYADKRLDEYTYVAIDVTLDFPPGTSRALHHGETPPHEVSPDGLEQLRGEVSELRDEVAGLVRLVARVIGERGRE